MLEIHAYLEKLMVRIKCDKKSEGLALDPKERVALTLEILVLEIRAIIFLLINFVFYL